MQGVITGKDVLKHLPLIWREFGTRCAVKALRAVLTGKKTTFLDVACTRSGALPQPPAQSPRRLWRS
jgi:hypothetical protein